MQIENHIFNPSLPPLFEDNKKVKTPRVTETFTVGSVTCHTRHPFASIILRGKS